MTRIAVAAATVTMLAVLTGCMSTDTTVGTPAAVADSAGPTDVAAAGSDPAKPGCRSDGVPRGRCSGGSPGHRRSCRGRCRRRVDGVGDGR